MCGAILHATCARGFTGPVTRAPMPHEPVGTLTLELDAELVTLDIACACLIVVQVKWPILGLIAVTGASWRVHLAPGEGIARAMGQAIVLHATLARIRPVAGAIAMIVVESGWAIAQKLAPVLVTLDELFARFLIGQMRGNIALELTIAILVVSWTLSPYLNDRTPSLEKNNGRTLSWHGVGREKVSN